MRRSFTSISSRSAAVLLASAALLGGGGVALAQGTGTAQAPAPAAATAPAAAPAAPVAARSQAPALNIRQIYDRMEAAGYRDLREIEWSHGRYEVKALDAQGARVKLEVDGSTGAVLRSRTKHH